MATKTAPKPSRSKKPEPNPPWDVLDAANEIKKNLDAALSHKNDVGAIAIAAFVLATKQAKRDLDNVKEIYQKEYDKFIDFWLMVKVEMGRLHGWLHRSDVLGDPALAAQLKVVADEVARTQKRLYDETLCNDNCKSMYFCEKKKGHRGRHGVYGLSWKR